MEKPPLDIEHAIDLILATPSMFSKKSEGQRNFGKLIVEEYYSKLRAENKDDPIAYRYLVNLFSTISSAVRAFGVQRDIFETSWKTVEEIKQYELEAAKRLTDYSPFRGGRFWDRVLGIIVSLFGGGGIGAAAGVLIKIENYQYFFILTLTLVGWVIGIIGLDYWLQKRKDSRISEIIKKYPYDVTDKWKKETIPQYKKIIRNFLYSAIKIREEFYPNLPTFDNLKIFESNMISHIQFEKKEEKISSMINEEKIEQHLNKIIERHFAF